MGAAAAAVGGRVVERALAEPVVLLGAVGLTVWAVRKGLRHRTPARTPSGVARAVSVVREAERKLRDSEGKPHVVAPEVVPLAAGRLARHPQLWKGPCLRTTERSVATTLSPGLSAACLLRAVRR